MDCRSAATDFNYCSSNSRRRSFKSSSISRKVGRLRGSFAMQAFARACHHTPPFACLNCYFNAVLLVATLSPMPQHNAAEGLKISQRQQDLQLTAHPGCTSGGNAGRRLSIATAATICVCVMPTRPLCSTSVHGQGIACHHISMAKSSQNTMHTAVRWLRMPAPTHLPTLATDSRAPP